MLGFNSLKFGYISKVLAQILYTTNLGNFKYDTYNEDKYGEELVTNGDFSDGTTGWSTTRGASARVEDGKYYLKNGDSLTTGASFTSIQTKIGKMYKVELDTCDTNDNTPFSFQVRTSPSYSGDLLYNMGNGGTEAERKEFTFIATTTTTYPHMVIYGGSLSTTELSFDNISVREVIAEEGDVYIDNKGLSNVSNDLLMYSGRGIELTGTQSVTITGDYITYFDFSDNQFHTATTSKTFENITVNNILTHTTNWSEADRIKIENNPNLIGKLALSETGSIDELDMELVEGDGWYPCMEKSGDIIYAKNFANTRLDQATYGLITQSANSVGDYVVVDKEELVNSEALNFTGTATLSNNGDYIRVANNADAYQYGTQGLSMVQGLRYTAKIEINIGTADIAFYGFYDFNNKSGNLDFRSTTDSGIYYIDFIATDNEEFIVLQSDDTNGHYADFKISVQLAEDTYRCIADAPSGTSLTNTTYFEPVSSYSEIENYTSTIRTNADFQNTGLQTTAFIKDSLNVPISYDDTALNWDGGSYGDSQFNPSLQDKFWFEEIVDNIIYQHNYDGTNLTTYTNNVASTPTAHTPEDASYLFGKGEYPKVTADGYTETVHKNIGFYTGSQYDKYNQGSRYIKLQGLI